MLRVHAAVVPKLARALKEVDASVPVIMLTGFGDVLSAQDERPDGVDEVLAKPVNRVTLHQTLRRLTGAQLALT